ncbi:MAG: hypothetical protein DRP81_07070, partial [Candidatus Omnitrophota bacterium]
ICYIDEEKYGEDIYGKDIEDKYEVFKIPVRNNQAKIRINIPDTQGLKPVKYTSGIHWNGYYFVIAVGEKQDTHLTDSLNSRIRISLSEEVFDSSNSNINCELKKISPTSLLAKVNSSEEFSSYEFEVSVGSGIGRGAHRIYTSESPEFQIKVSKDGLSFYNTGNHSHPWIVYEGTYAVRVRGVKDTGTSKIYSPWSNWVFQEVRVSQKALQEEEKLSQVTTTSISERGPPSSQTLLKETSSGSISVLPQDNIISVKAFSLDVIQATPQKLSIINSSDTANSLQKTSTTHIFRGSEGAKISHITLLRDGKAESFTILTNAGQPKTIPDNLSSPINLSISTPNLTLFDTPIPRIYTTPIINQNGQFNLFFYSLPNATENTTYMLLVWEENSEDTDVYLIQSQQSYEKSHLISVPVQINVSEVKKDTPQRYFLQLYVWSDNPQKNPNASLSKFGSDILVKEINLTNSNKSLPIPEIQGKSEFVSYSASVYFQWTKHKEYPKEIFYVVERKDLSDNTTSYYTTYTNSFTQTEIEPGDYEYRVRAIYGEEIASNWSEPLRLKVKRVEDFYFKKPSVYLLDFKPEYEGKEDTGYFIISIKNPDFESLKYWRVSTDEKGEVKDNYYFGQKPEAVEIEIINKETNQSIYHQFVDVDYNWDPPVFTSEVNPRIPVSLPSGEYLIRSRFWAFNPVKTHSESKDVFSDWQEKEIKIERVWWRDNLLSKDLIKKGFSSSDSLWKPVLREDIIKRDVEDSDGILEVGIVPGAVDINVDNGEIPGVAAGAVGMRVQVRYPSTKSGYAEQTFYVPGFYTQFPVLIDKLIEKDGVYQAEVCIKVEVIYIDKEGNVRLSPSTSYIKKVSIPEEKVSLLRETPWYDTSLHQFIIEKKEGENTTIQYKYEIGPFKAEIKSVEKYDTSDPENWLLKEANYLTKLAQYKGTASLREIINQFNLSSKPEKKLLEIYPENTSLNIYQIQEHSEISYCFYLEGYTLYPVLVMGDRIITVFDKENKTAYSYYPETGDLVYRDRFLKRFTSNVSSQIREFMNNTAKVKFEERKDEFNASFNNFVKNIKEAEIWVREAYGKNIYMIYDSEHRYPVITIDEIKVHFGEKIDSVIWRQRSFEKVPIRLPVTTPPIVLIRERTGRVIERDELLKEFPFLNLTQRNLPQVVEEYIAYDSKGQVWYTYYQEPRDVFGRVILRVSSIDEGRYVYYVKEYNKTNIYQPKLAYLYFNPKNEKEGAYSDNWYKCFTYKTEEILTLKNIFAELNLSFEDREFLKK